MLHVAYGKALLTSHQLEMRLSMLLQCHAVEHDYPAPQEAIKKMTLGVLVNEFIEKYDPPDSLAEELDNMVFFRNELAHRISSMIVHRTAATDWHDKVMQDLIDIEVFLRDTNELLNPYIEHCYHVLGMTKHQVRRIAQRVYPGLEGALSNLLDAE
jgi:hypothetical protein